jgi:hypothetical protein
VGPGRTLGYASRVPPLFRRKSTDLVADATSSVTPGQASDSALRPKGYTPSKKELGVQTPKRTNSQRRRGTEPAPANRREAYKQMRARQREERAEASTGMRNGEEKFLLVGTWFFLGAIVVLVGSSTSMPVVVQVASNVIWAVLALGVVLDSIRIARKTKKLVLARFPKTEQKMGSLYLYGITRGLTFRRMRVPKPQVELGDTV